MTSTTNLDLAIAILRATDDNGTIQAHQMLALGLPAETVSVASALRAAGIDVTTAGQAARAEGWADNPLAD